jgi:polyhydroxyalkanoate synthesis regulator phasin
MAAKSKTKKATRAKAKPGNKKSDRAKGNGSSNATDLLKDSFYVSIGALVMAEEQASSIIDSLVKTGKKAKRTGKKYIKELNKEAPEKPRKSEKAEKKQEAGEDWILRALHWLNVPTHRDLEQINKKVDVIARKVA